MVCVVSKLQEPDASTSPRLLLEDPLGCPAIGARSRDISKTQVAISLFEFVLL